MADLSTLGSVVAAGGAALILLFVHLRGHAEKFRDENRERATALRSRLGNDLFLDVLTKFVPQIDTMLKRSSELLTIRKQLIGAMSTNEPLGPVLQNVSDVVESAPPTAEQSKQIKDLTQQLSKKFETQDALLKSYEDGWKQEQVVANLVLRFACFQITLGILGVATSVGLSASSPETSWLIYAELGAFLLALLLLMTGVDAYNRYQKASAAQSKFLESMDAELYSVPQTVQTQLKSS